MLPVLLGWLSCGGGCTRLGVLLCCGGVYFLVVAHMLCSHPVPCVLLPCPSLPLRYSSKDSKKYRGKNKTVSQKLKSVGRPTKK